jgi:putative PIN family toxin of toxin-antitoxin system
MKVVIDCNIFVSSLTSKSKYHKIFEALINQEFELLITTDIVLEYEEIIQIKYGLKTAKLFTELLFELPNVKIINTFFNWQLIKVDADDNKYCDCYVAGGGNFLVSNDKHFVILKSISFPKIELLNIDQFFSLLK